MAKKETGKMDAEGNYLCDYCDYQAAWRYQKGWDRHAILNGKKFAPDANYRMPKILKEGEVFLCGTHNSIFLKEGLKGLEKNEKS